MSSTSSPSIDHAAAQTRAIMRAGFVSKIERLRADLAVSVIESHPWRVAQTDGTILFGDADGYRFGGDIAGNACFRTREAAEALAAAWNRENPGYPVAAMLQRSVVEARIASLSTMIEWIDEAA